MLRSLLNRGRPFDPGRDSESVLTVDVAAVTVTPQPSRLTRIVRRAWEVLIDTLDCIARYPYPPIEI
ncbi:hypothetical protein H6F46_11910 [Limnothrix sp. FACHB-1083]|uniref:hypothetical protein n=1 Tax=unclassified Limnothrix TaxID=2632864 RepID=UPI001681ABFC|nr:MULTISPECIES: hypothetical protein [unclassified Limnothrix]MBD2161395.1 hypothetical protein [Limnothrix sp. FACHB-1083]MBD2192093.1 hypothetical protein [Limnothrix sp. FACHB-1088]